jgi:hypothetical protein
MKLFWTELTLSKIDFQSALYEYDNDLTTFYFWIAVRKHIFSGVTGRLITGTGCFCDILILCSDFLRR